MKEEKKKKMWWNKESKGHKTWTAALPSQVWQQVEFGLVNCVQLKQSGWSRESGSDVAENIAVDLYLRGFLLVALCILQLRLDLTASRMKV